MSETKKCTEDNEKLSETNKEVDELDPIKILDFSKYPRKDHEKITQYLQSLDEISVKALIVAQEHLETSFNVLKCIGYQKWIKNNM